MKTLRRGAVAIESPDEFSAAEVLADGFGAWLSQLPAFAGFALLVHTPLLAFTFVPELPRAALAGAFLVVEIAAAAVVRAGLTKAVLDGQRGLRSEFTDLLDAAARKGPAAVLLQATIFISATARTLLLVAPGLKYLCDTFAAVPAVVAERSSLRDALSRSRRLSRGARLRIFAVALVAWTVSATVTISSGFLAGSSEVRVSWLVGYLCARALDTSLAAALAAMTYHHLGARPEGT